VNRQKEDRAGGSEAINGRKPFDRREGEAETLERMRALRRKPKGGERMSFAAIASKLDAEGRPSRSGKPWIGSTHHHPEGIPRRRQERTSRRHHHVRARD
jgi:hypothetical protein